MPKVNFVVVLYHVQLFSSSPQSKHERCSHYCPCHTAQGERQSGCGVCVCEGVSGEA